MLWLYIYKRLAYSLTRLFVYFIIIRPLVAIVKVPNGVITEDAKEYYRDEV